MDPKPMKYNIKKTIFIITACSVVILAVAVINYRIARHVVEQTVIAQQRDFATKAVYTVEIWLNQQTKILKAAAASVSLSSMGHDAATMLPLHMAMKAGHFSDVYIGTITGNLIDGAEW
jgi:sensor c-di-GMP phosphodiesterase-like protein